jgi:hypothetical protein
MKHALVGVVVVVIAASPTASCGGSVSNRATGDAGAQVEAAGPAVDGGAPEGGAGGAAVDAGDGVSFVPDVLATTGVADPAVLAVDSTSVYWNTAVAVMKVAKGGGQAVTLAAVPQPSAVAVDSSSVYFAALSQIMKVPLGGGAPVTIAASGATQAIAVDAQSVYWSDNRGPIDRVPLDGGAITYLGSGLCYPERVAIDAHSVYWIDCGISKAPLGGGGPTVMLAGTGNAGGLIAVDATGVYFTGLTSTAGVTSVPPSGGAVRSLAQAKTPSGLALDASNVYWCDKTLGTVDYVPKVGGVAVTLATGQPNPRGIALDTSYVYFGTDTGIVRVGKP